MDLLQPPTDPAQLASIQAELRTPDDSIERTSAAERLLAELDHAADQFGFHGKSYFIEAGRAFVLAADVPQQGPITWHDFRGLTFEGEFSTYSDFRMNGLHVPGHKQERIRSLCLVFGSATMLPFFDSLPDQDILYVPVLAVASISPS